jgi:hypothetical protein
MTKRYPEGFCFDGHPRPVDGCHDCERIKHFDPLRYYLYTADFARAVRATVAIDDKDSWDALRDSVLARR